MIDNAALNLKVNNYLFSIWPLHCRLPVRQRVTRTMIQVALMMHCSAGRTQQRSATNQEPLNQFPTNRHGHKHI